MVRRRVRTQDDGGEVGQVPCLRAGTLPGLRKAKETPVILADPRVRAGGDGEDGAEEGGEAAPGFFDIRSDDEVGKGALACARPCIERMDNAR